MTEDEAKEVLKQRIENVKEAIDNVDVVLAKVQADLQECWKDWVSHRNLDDVTQRGNWFIAERYKEIDDVKSTLSYNLRQLNLILERMKDESDDT